MPLKNLSSDASVCPTLMRTDALGLCVESIQKYLDDATIVELATGFIENMLNVEEANLEMFKTKNGVSTELTALAKHPAHLEISLHVLNALCAVTRANDFMRIVKVDRCSANIYDVLKHQFNQPKVFASCTVLLEQLVKEPTQLKPLLTVTNLKDLMTMVPRLRKRPDDACKLIQLILVLLMESSTEILREINMESFYTEVIIYAHILSIQSRVVDFLLKVCSETEMAEKMAEEGCVPLLVHCLQKHIEESSFCEQTLKVLALVLLNDKTISVFMNNGGLPVVLEVMKKYEDISEVMYRGYVVLWSVCQTRDYCGIAIEKGVSDLLKSTYDKYMKNEKIVACCIGFCHQMVLYPVIASALAVTDCLKLIFDTIRMYAAEEDMMDHCVIILTKMLEADLPESAVVQADVLSIVVDAMQKSAPESSLREDACLFLVALLHNEEARQQLIQLNLTDFLIGILKSSEKWSLLSAVCCTLEVLCVDEKSLQVMEDEKADELCEKKLHSCQEYPEFIGSCSKFLCAYLENRALQKKEESPLQSADFFNFVSLLLDKSYVLKTDSIVVSLLALLGMLMRTMSSPPVYYEIALPSKICSLLKRFVMHTTVSESCWEILGICTQTDEDATQLIRLGRTQDLLENARANATSKIVVQRSLPIFCLIACNPTLSDSLVNVDILKMLLMIIRGSPDDVESQCQCMTIMARMVKESPEEAAKKIDENAEDELDDDDVAEEKKRRRELKKEEEKKNRHKSKKIEEDKEVAKRRAVLTELSVLDNVNLLASCVKRFPENAALLSDTSDVLVSVCVNSEEARRLVAVSGVVAPYFEALQTKDLSLLSHALSLMAELVKVASVKAVLHQLHPGERIIRMIEDHMKRLHDNTTKMPKDELARKMVCILVEMSASRELLNDFAETPGLPVIVDVQNRYISDPYIQLCIAGYLNNLMPMKDIPEQFMKAKGLPATVSSLSTYLRKRTLMKMFCEVLYTLVKTYPEVSPRVSREVTPVLENCLKKNQKKMEHLEPPIRLLTYLVMKPENVCRANEVLKCCTDVMYNNRENKEVLPPFLTITNYVLRSGYVTVDFLASGTLQFFCWLCDVYGKQPEVLGYVLGVVSAIAYLSRRNLDALEEFKLPEIAMDSQKAFAKAELVQQHAAGILSLYSDIEEYRKVMVDRRVLVYLLRAMSNYSSNKDLVLYCLETCNNLVDEEACLKDFTEQLGVDTTLRCMLCLPQNTNTTIDAIMLSLRLCYLTFQRDSSQIEKMAREGVMAVLLYAVKNLHDNADDMASVLQMLQLICADKKCCPLALQQPFIAAFMDVHESYVGDVVINESMLCIMWYMSNYDGIAEALFHENNFELMPRIMTDFKRSAVIQTWTCKLLYNMSKRSDCVDLLRESLITRNLLQVVNDFPRTLTSCVLRCVRFRIY